MTIFYLDPAAGNDASAGTSWATAWQTITSGATSVRIAAGDVIRIAKSPDPVSIGNALWTDTNAAATASVAITSSTNATPIVITKTAHGFTNGTAVQVSGHTTNTAANGQWIVANVSANTYELAGSVGNGIGGATGYALRIANKVVQLVSAQTKIVSYCESNWTAIAGGDCTPTLVLAATDAKSGGGCVKLTLDAAVQTSVGQAYFATGTLDLSAYQRLTFWMKSTIAYPASSVVIKLCSDTAGVTAVDTFTLPVGSGYVNNWFPITVARDGAGNLGAAIQSIAIYSGGTSPGNSNVLQIDNINACTTAGLNLQSLITKNAAAQGGNEGCWGIQSICGVMVSLDSSPNTTSISTTARGYSGVTETVATYFREAFKTPMATLVGDLVQAVQQSGSIGSRIEFQGGWDTGLNTQIGETFFDGLNGAGYGLSATGKSYVTLNNFNLFRYYTNMNLLTGSSYIILDNIGNLNNASGIGLSVTASSYITINSLRNANSNLAGGCYFSGTPFITLGTLVNSCGANGTAFQLNTGCDNANITSITNLLNNFSQFQCSVSGLWLGTLTNVKYHTGTASGVYFNGGNNCRIETIGTILPLGASSCIEFLSSNNNFLGRVTTATAGAGKYGVRINASRDCSIKSISTSGGAAGVSIDSGTLVMRNATIAQATPVAFASPLYNAKVQCENYQLTAGNHWTFTDSGTINSLATDRAGGTGLMWKLAITGAARTPNYPIALPIAKVYMVANTTYAVKAWFKKDHATNVMGMLVIRGAQLNGISVSDVVAMKSDIANTWEQLSVTVTPTESGVVEVEAQAAYAAGNANVYVEDVSVV